jgi:hypothetical protein
MWLFAVIGLIWLGVIFPWLFIVYLIFIAIALS